MYIIAQNYHWGGGGVSQVQGIRTSNLKSKQVISSLN